MFIRGSWRCQLTRHILVDDVGVDGEEGHRQDDARFRRGNEKDLSREPDCEEGQENAQNGCEKPGHERELFPEHAGEDWQGRRRNGEKPVGLEDKQRVGERNRESSKEGGSERFRLTPAKSAVACDAVELSKGNEGHDGLGPN